MRRRASGDGGERRDQAGPRRCRHCRCRRRRRACLACPRPSGAAGRLPRPGRLDAARGPPPRITDWEWQRATRWSTAPNVRRLPQDYPVDSSDELTLMWNGVGGSTTVYTATWPRFRPSDFRKGTEHGLQPDWPFAYEDLAPWYERHDQMAGVSGLLGDRAIPRAGPSRPGPCPPGPLGGVVSRGFERLGWHWWPMPCAIMAEPYDGRLACNNCGAASRVSDRGALMTLSSRSGRMPSLPGRSCAPSAGSNASRPDLT